MDKYITGIWNCDKADSRLGSFLIFQQELLLKCEVSGFENVELIIIGEKTETLYPYWNTMAQLNPRVSSVSFEDKFDESRIKSINYWPPEELFDRCSYSGSTLVLQELWSKSGQLINFKSPKYIRCKAQNWIIKHIGIDYIIITIHLKNNPSDEQSNANQESWFKFIQNCYLNKLPVRFVLICNDKIDLKISELPNVVLSKDHGGDLGLDLALIELSFFFMGMSSGPCNMAILSDKPYLIWKHPGHHEKEMEIELQGHKQFVFANRYQKFMQDWDTPKNIQCEFSNLFNQLNPDFYKYQSYVDQL